MGQRAVPNDVSLARDNALVGRDGETERLRELVRNVAAGHGQAVWVEGEPGIGKSSLVAAGLAEAASLGCETAWATADELSRRSPLHVMLDCLRIDPRTSPEGRRGMIAELLRGGPSTVAPGIANPLWPAMEGLLALVDELCAAAPLVMVIDDMQWADEASQFTWHRLAQVVNQLPLLLVAVCRPMPQGEQVDQLRDSVLARDAVLIPVGPLTDSQASELVSSLVGEATDASLRNLAAAASGNPLYLREMADVLVHERESGARAGPVTAVADGAPASLTAVITRRLGFLPSQVLELLRAAAMFGHEFTVADVAAMLGTSPVSLLAGLDYARNAGVVVESGPLLRFRHPLIHRALRDSMPSALRVALHRQAAEALARGGAPAERVAEQLLAASAAVDRWALDWTAENAARLTHQAPETAVHLLRRILDHHAGAGPDQLEVIAATLAKALFRLGRNEEAERQAWQMLAHARNPELAAEMRWILARVLFSAGRNKQALAVTEQALRAGPSAMWRARLQALLAMFLRADEGEVEIAESGAGQALALSEAAEDRFGIGYALCVLWLVDSVRRDHTRALERVDRALEVVGNDLDHRDLRSWSLDNRMFTLQNLDRLADAEANLQASAAEAERRGDPSQAALHIGAAVHYFWVGRWDDALASLDAVVAEGPEVTHYGLRERGPVLLYHGVAALIAGHRDDRPAAREHLDAGLTEPVITVSDWENRDFLTAAEALDAERDGDEPRALALLVPLLSARPGQMTLIHQWLPDLVRLADGLGDDATARAALHACEQEAAHEAVPARATAAANRCRALISSDPGPLVDAAAHYLSVGRPFERAQSLEDAAVLLARAGEQDEARRTLNAAAELYGGLGADWDLRRADTRLRPFGIRRGVRGSRKRPSTGWEALSPTELKVAHLVAEGKSNPEIAVDLFLSRRTVQTHVSHILGKLGVRSRVEIATMALSHSGGAQARGAPLSSPRRA
ncbi:AAA family ATPase [Streptomyces sp. NBC_00829]|uniref:helix-turn-helix transcriptional regulator n=1 Tax=Streptomyces sp. NBC_00829 TaxID=2903679 RepID=UPI0038671E55|nr:AAA family ATPase [Streptomyces sp. NBC_00829]